MTTTAADRATQAHATYTESVAATARRLRAIADRIERDADRLSTNHTRHVQDVVDEVTSGVANLSMSSLIAWAIHADNLARDAELAPDTATL